MGMCGGVFISWAAPFTAPGTMSISGAECAGRFSLLHAGERQEMGQARILVSMCPACLSQHFRPMLLRER